MHIGRAGASQSIQKSQLSRTPQISTASASKLCNSSDWVGFVQNRRVLKIQGHSMLLLFSLWNVLDSDDAASSL